MVPTKTTFPFHLKRTPSNVANRIEMSVWDKVKNKWHLLEGSVCQEGKIKEKTELKQEKYTYLRAGIKNIYKESEVIQFKIVLDFLGGYNLTLEETSTLTEDKRETLYLLKKAQK